MNPEPEPADQIEATRNIVAGVSIGLFLWGVALGYAAHTIKEHITCL